VAAIVVVVVDAVAKEAVAVAPTAAIVVDVVVLL